mgnify:CR=1 FL=1
MTRYKNNENQYELPILTAAQSRMARTGLGLGIRDIAKLAGVSTNTLHRLESSEQLQSRTLITIRQTYETAGAEFIFSKDGRVGVVVQG